MAIDHGAKWLHYADPAVAHLRRSCAGSITPIIRWLLYGDPGMAPLGRSVTLSVTLLEEGFIFRDGFEANE
jgi:hypothetical protein